MLTTSNVSLEIEAAANSFCAVRAVDKSVLLLKTETELSAETVSYPNKYIFSFLAILFYSLLQFLHQRLLACIGHPPLFTCAGHNNMYIIRRLHFLAVRCPVKDLGFDLSSDSWTCIVIWEASGDDHKSISTPHRDSFILGTVPSERCRARKDLRKSKIPN